MVFSFWNNVRVQILWKFFVLYHCTEKMKNIKFLQVFHAKPVVTDALGQTEKNMKNFELKRQFIIAPDLYLSFRAKTQVKLLSPHPPSVFSSEMRASHERLITTVCFYILIWKVHLLCAQSYFFFLHIRKVNFCAS